MPIAGNDIFQRIEKKYLMNKERYEKMMEMMSEFMKMDQHGPGTICNIYYDTSDYELIRRSMDKPIYKEKLRMRSYGTPGEKDEVYIELKKKWQGIVYKRRVQMTLKEARNYLDHGIKPQKDSQILNEIDYFINFYKPERKKYIAYDRVALVDVKDSGIRITFDSNMRYRDDDLDLKAGSAGHLLVDLDQILMEVKVPGAYPLWLVTILSDLKIYPTTFSKYGVAYMKSAYEFFPKQADRENEKEVKICLPA